MTGFGTASREHLGRVYTLETRSVNHRYCEVRVHVPSELGGVTTKLEAMVRERVQRGRVDVGLNVTTAPDAVMMPRIDLAKARGYQQAYRDVATALGLEAKASLEMILTAPGVVRPPELVGGEGALEAAIAPALVEALDGLCVMRETEGAALGKDLESHLVQVREMVSRIGSEVPAALAERRTRLESRLEELLGEQTMDPMRLAQEVAVLVDRTDVTEEIQRLGSHLEQFSTLLAGDGPVGRKLDFLLQEMNRETNTIGAKSNSAAIAYLVVDAKAELERMREQIQNVE